MALLRFLSCGLIVYFSVSGELSAQTAISTITGSTTSFGLRVAGLGDVDSDGTPDFSVADGAALPSSFGHPVYFPYVYIYSGATHQILNVMDQLPEAGFGTDVRRCGDFDGNGRDDILINGRIYDPLTEALLLQPPAFLFTVVRSVGDVNSDGHCDVAYFAGAGNTGEGSVGVLSGSTHQPIWITSGPEPEGNMGSTIVAIGDLDGDNVPDVLVGAPGNRNAPVTHGRAYCLSGVDGAIIHTFVGPGIWSFFGVSVAAIRDVDGDGIDEVFIVSPGANGYQIPNPNGTYGAYYLYSGQTGQLLNVRYLLPGEGNAFPFFPARSQSLLWPISADFDQDGCGDAVMRGLNNTPGSCEFILEVISGRTLECLNGLPFVSNPQLPLGGSVLAQSVDMIDDHDADGIPELLVSEGVQPPIVLPDPGRAHIYSMVTTGFSAFGAASTLANGATPKVGASGELIAGKSLTLNISGIAPNSGCALIFGSSDSSWFGTTLPVGLPFFGAGDAALRVSPEVIVGGLGSIAAGNSGLASFSMTVPAQPILTGLTIFGQWMFDDPGAVGLPLGLSQGVRLVVQ